MLIIFVITVIVLVQQENVQCQKIQINVHNALLQLYILTLLNRVSLLLLVMLKNMVFIKIYLFIILILKNYY